MPYRTPIAAITALIDARNAGHVETALGVYSPAVTVVLQPGAVLTGLDGARAALEGFIALKPIFTVTSREFLASDSIALHYSHWTLVGAAPDGSSLALSGDSTDVLVKQDDGGWLLAIDNPYGAAGPPSATTTRKG